MNIAYIVNESAGVNYHRLEIPFSYLANEHTEHSFAEIQFYDMGTSDYDVLIFNRIPYQPYSNIEELKRRGVKIIYDLDDYWARPMWHSNYSAEYEKSYTLEIIKYLKLADVVWTPSKNLQKHIAELGVKAHYIPNAISLGEEQFKPLEKASREPIIGYVGNANHHMDFMQLPKIDVKADFRLCGVNQLDNLTIYMGNKLAGKYGNRLKFIKSTNVYNYARLYNEIDICVLPNYNDKYSLCKSNLKLLEAGAFKLPVITNGGIYSEVNGKIGLRVKEPKDWNKGLNKLVQSQRMRTELGEALYEYTQEKYNLKKINELRWQTIV